MELDTSVVSTNPTFLFRNMMIVEFALDMSKVETLPFASCLTRSNGSNDRTVPLPIGFVSLHESLPSLLVVGSDNNVINEYWSEGVLCSPW